MNKCSLAELNAAIVAGFDMAVAKGPLMDEPMFGTVLIVEGLDS